MKRLCAVLFLLSASPPHAQTPVDAAHDPGRLFTSSDPKLNANKQAVLHIVRDLLEAHHWSDADKYLTAPYIQHNPWVASGREPVIRFLGNSQPLPIPAKMKTQVVAVVAEGDLIVVSYRQQFADPHHAGQCYTTTWFDMWRILNGKADEHWDPATLGPTQTSPCH